MRDMAEVIARLVFLVEKLGTERNKYKAHYERVLKLNAFSCQRADNLGDSLHLAWRENIALRQEVNDLRERTYALNDELDGLREAHAS
jgi:hypothetical protein